MRMNRKLVVVGAVLAASIVGAPAASAGPVTAAYVFSTFSFDAAASGTPLGYSPGFTITGTDGVSLTLDANGVATGQQDIADGVSAYLSQQFLYNVYYGGTPNVGESNGTTPAHINAEVGRVDDVGFAEPGSDALLNLDYSSTSFAHIFFDVPAAGVSRILLVEDGGLDPFKLTYCWGLGGNTCTDSPAAVLFDGFSDPAGTVSVWDDVIARSDFDIDDAGSDVDQAFLFVLNQVYTTGYFRLSHSFNPTWNPAGDTLEVDFLGGGQAPIPEPGSMLLLGSGLVGLAGAARRRMRK